MCAGDNIFLSNATKIYSHICVIHIRIICFCRVTVRVNQCRPDILIDMTLYYFMWYHTWNILCHIRPSLKASLFRGANMGLTGADRTQVGPIWAPWFFLSGIMTWKHYSYYWIMAMGIHRSLMDSPHKGPLLQSFGIIFSMKNTSNKRLNWSGINTLRPSCDVTVMYIHMDSRNLHAYL